MLPIITPQEANKEELQVKDVLKQQKQEVKQESPSQR